MNTRKSIDQMTNQALHILGINKNDYKQQIDALIENTTNEILGKKSKGAGTTLLAGSANIIAGGPNVLAAGKKKPKPKKAKKPRSAKQLKRDKLLKFFRSRGLTMKQSNAKIKQHDLMNREIDF